MCVFVRVRRRASDFFWLFFFRSVLWRPAAVIWCANPIVLQHFFCVSHFLLFLFRFCVCFGPARRDRVRILFLPFLCLLFSLVYKPSCFETIFLGFAFFAFSLPFLCLLWARPAVNEVEFCFLPFLCFLFFGIQTLLF